MVNSQIDDESFEDLQSEIMVSLSDGEENKGNVDDNLPPSDSDSDSEDESDMPQLESDSEDETANAQEQDVKRTGASDAKEAENAKDAEAVTAKEAEIAQIAKYAEMAPNAQTSKDVEPKDAKEEITRPMSILTDSDTPLNLAIWNFIEQKEKMEADKIREQALYAVKLFYRNAIENEGNITCTMDMGKIVIEGKGNKTNPRDNTSLTVWNAMQNPKVQEHAIQLCKNENVILQLDYGVAWSWKMTTYL